MINYYFKTWEAKEIWTADIYANNELITTVKPYVSEKEAVRAAQKLIQGIKDARGEV